MAVHCPVSPEIPAILPPADVARAAVVLKSGFESAFPIRKVPRHGAFSKKFRLPNAISTAKENPFTNTGCIKQATGFTAKAPCCISNTNSNIDIRTYRNFFGNGQIIVYDIKILP